MWRSNDFRSHVPLKQMGLCSNNSWKLFGSFNSRRPGPSRTTALPYMCEFFLDPRILARHSNSIPGKQNLLKASVQSPVPWIPPLTYWGPIITFSGTLPHNLNSDMFGPIV